MKSLTVSEYIWEHLSSIGVSHVFLLPGGGCMYLVDALSRNESIVPIPMLHEQSVGVAAEAYAQYRNQVGVALVTTGPGGTNAVTACAAAWTDSTPMIFISGQVKLGHLKDGSGLRQRGFQEVSIVEIVEPITKRALSVRTVTEAFDAIHELCKLAKSGRPGPVWLDIPLDIQNALIPEDIFEVNESFQNEYSPSIEEKQVKDLLLKWSESKRPVILAGNGIRTAGMVEFFRTHMPKFNTPIMLTWKAIDFLAETNPLNAGRPGAIAQPWSNLAIQNSDFVLILGARMDMGQLAYNAGTFARLAEVAIVDIDPSELEKFNHLDWELFHLDVQDFLTDIEAYRKEYEFNFRGWMDEILALKKEFPLPPENQKVLIDGVSNYTFFDKLSAHLKPNDLIVPGSSGACSEITMQAFRVKLGQRVLNSEALGPMGFGIPAAIGANIASGGQRTISVDGDGGIMMNIQELATVAGRKLDIKFFIQNNDGYESIRSTQDSLFSGRHLGIDGESGIYIPDFKEIARAFKIPYFCISKNEQIDRVLSQVLDITGPAITEIFVSKESKTTYKVSSYVKNSGEIDSYPLEDMSPPVPIHRLREIVRPELLEQSINRTR
jgi:acetolactate synthase-1/2/3 large subunit